jgi:hypothetical protein
MTSSRAITCDHEIASFIDSVRVLEMHDRAAFRIRLAAFPRQRPAISGFFILLNTWAALPRTLTNAA